jgi:hypothetical protein
MPTAYIIKKKSCTKHLTIRFSSNEYKCMYSSIQYMHQINHPKAPHDLQVISSLVNITDTHSWPPPGACRSRPLHLTIPLITHSSVLTATPLPAPLHSIPSHSHRARVNHDPITGACTPLIVSTIYSYCHVQQSDPRQPSVSFPAAARNRACGGESQLEAA